MDFIDGRTLNEIVEMDLLIVRLREAFANNTIEVPLRHHHALGVDNTLLLMPAWKNKNYGGVKIITVCPNNREKNLPSIQGIYYLFNASTGVPVCTIDAPTLTNLRTSGASALASSYLSRKDSSTLLMIGTGNLAPYLIKAHTTARPISKVLVYGRRIDRAEAVCKTLSPLPFTCLPIQSIEEGIEQADIISCATLSSTPLIKGEWLREGQHIDLVGSFKPDMREADDQTIKRSSLFVDTFEGATKESGDIVMPLNNGSINLNHIKGDLVDLCTGKLEGRANGNEITCFKSVGHALEDLVAAELAYKLMSHSNL